MEQALFSPPLSKQRVEYAVQSIKESCATTLVNKFLFYFDFTLIILDVQFYVLIDCCRLTLDVALVVCWIPY